MRMSRIALMNIAGHRSLAPSAIGMIPFAFNAAMDAVSSSQVAGTLAPALAKSSLLT